MTSMEAFLGADTVARPSSGMVMASGQPVRSVSSARPSSGFVMSTSRALHEATQFSESAITVNMNSATIRAAVHQFENAINMAWASNNMTQVTSMFIGTLKTTRNLMQSMVKSGLMTDANTQAIADRIAIGNIFLQKISNAFPQGISTTAATEAEQLISEIDALVSELQAKRNADYQRVMSSKAVAQQVIASFNAMPDTGATVPGSGAVTSPEVPGYGVQDSVPGGGSAEAGTSAPVAVQKTAAQKYGPVLALVAGTVAAYYAFK